MSAAFALSKITPARHIWPVPFDSLRITKDYNIRTHYGDMEELVRSIRANGVLTPFEGVDRGTHLDVRRGHRRHRAVGIARKEIESELKGATGAARKELAAQFDRLASVPFTPYEGGSLDEQYDLDISNSGLPLSLMEKARLYQRLMKDFKQSEADIKRRTGISKTALANCFLLLNGACDGLIAAIESGKMSGSLGVELVRKFPDKATQETLVKQALDTAEKSGRPTASAKHFEDGARKKLEPNTKGKDEEPEPPDRTPAKGTKPVPPEKVKTVRIRKKEIKMPRKCGFSARTLVGEVMTVTGESRGFVCTAFINIAGVKQDRAEKLRIRDESKLSDPLLIRYESADTALHTALCLVGELMDKAAVKHKVNRKLDVTAAQAALDAVIKPVDERLHPKKPAAKPEAKGAAPVTLVPDAIHKAPPHIVALRDALKKRLGDKAGGERYKTLNFIADYLAGRYDAETFEKFFTEFLLGQDKR